MSGANKIKTSPSFLLRLFCFFSACLLLPVPEALAQGATARTKLKLYGAVDEFAMMCMAAGISLEDVKLPSRITRVKPGSPAFYSGVTEGDDVISATPGTDSLVLQIERKGRRYMANIPINMEAMRLRMSLMQRLQEKMDSELKEKTSSAPSRVAENQLRGLQPYDAKLDVERFYRSLAPYKLVVLVDRSDSMKAGLGIGPGDISRWTWCEQQLKDLTKFCQGKLAGGITIIPFNDVYQVLPNCSSKDLEYMYDNVIPEGSTNIYNPLQAVISEQLRTAAADRIPMLIVILTDGLPNQGDPLDTLIMDATKKLDSPTDLVITFFQIGKTLESDELLERLDKELVSSGASMDIVKCRYFEELLSIGLKQAMLESVEDAARAQSHEALVRSRGASKQ
jgi:hypothetical protein